MIQNKSLTPVKVQLLPPSTKHKCDHAGRSRPIKVEIIIIQTCLDSKWRRLYHWLQSSARDSNSSIACSCSFFDRSIIASERKSTKLWLSTQHSATRLKFLPHLLIFWYTCRSIITNERNCSINVQYRTMRQTKSIKQLKPGVDKNGNDFKTMEEQKKLNTAKTTTPRKMKMEEWYNLVGLGEQTAWSQ